MKSFLTCIDIWISTSTKQRQKRHHKWKTRNNLQQWRNKKWLSRGYCNMHTKSTYFRNSLQRVPFDLDSQLLMVDDGASASITNDLLDFVTRPTAIYCKVKRIAGSAKQHIMDLSNRKLKTTTILLILLLYQIHITSLLPQQESYHHNILLNKCRILSHTLKEQGV